MVSRTQRSTELSHTPKYLIVTSATLTVEKHSRLTLSQGSFLILLAFDRKVRSLHPPQAALPHFPTELSHTTKYIKNNTHFKPLYFTTVYLLCQGKIYF